MALTTAILAYAHSLTLQQMDQTNALVGQQVTLQTTSVKPKKHKTKISLTNSFSPPGKTEFGIGMYSGTIHITGIVDINGYFDLLWTTIMENPYYAWAQFYAALPAAVAAPRIYTAKLQFEDVEIDCTTSDDGKVWTFDATANVSGSINQAGGSGYVYIVGAAS